MVEASAPRPSPKAVPPSAPGAAATLASNPPSLSAASLAAASDALPPMDKIIVAIHGIGSQLRSSTIRSVARRFGDRCDPPLPVMPLGYFNIGKVGEVRVSRLDARPTDPLARIGFAEVFWADIPDQVVKANDTLEETKAWGRTVVSRAEKTYRDNVTQRCLTSDDFQLGVGVVEEIVETIGVLDKLLKVTAQAGLFKFELAPLLRSYVGDVQLVTDFPFYRQKIIHRFHSAMAQIVKTFTELHPDRTPEIYIVAHSEGTVVSFLGLLEALSGRDVFDPDPGPASAGATPSKVPPVPVDSRWIADVRGYMTIGSPIDKHIALWPKLWEGLDLTSHRDASGRVVFPAADAQASGRLTLKQPIQWRNYYDYGDPIGFQLDTARRLLSERNCTAFEFTAEHDHGFSRYWLPGKAHNDYWDDAEVFGHFIDDVVSPTGTGTGPSTAKPPQSYWWVDKLSMAIPYAITFVLHLAAVYLLYRAVIPAAPAVTVELVGPPVSAWEPFLNVFFLSMLLMAITVAARLPRLVKPDGIRWHLLALLIFLAAALPSAFALPTSVVSFLGGYLVDALTRWTGLELDKELTGQGLLLGMAFVIASSGWWLSRKPNHARKLLLYVGGGGIGLVVASRLFDGSLVAPVWPVLLAGLAFLYLWWLGILLFDLTFIWHRYIRRSVAVDTLAHWCQNRDARPMTMLGLGKQEVPATASGTGPASANAVKAG